MAEQQQQFYLLLGNLMSPDNDVRKQSEVRQRDVADLTSDTSGWYILKRRDRASEKLTA